MGVLVILATIAAIVGTWTALAAADVERDPTRQRIGGRRTRHMLGLGCSSVIGGLAVLTLGHGAGVVAGSALLVIGILLLSLGEVHRYRRTPSSIGSAADRARHM